MEKHSYFTRDDIKQIKAWGLSRKDVEKQLALYRRRLNFIKLDRPCMRDDGIMRVNSAQRKRIIARYNDEAKDNKVLKFVPASGAASRMFARWFVLAQKETSADLSGYRAFMKNLQKMPFFPLIEQSAEGRELLKQRSTQALSRYILMSEGMNFGALPKALIPFHLYPDNEMRTALEEHLFEAAGYISDAKGVCRLHFTVSPEHLEIVAAAVRPLKKKYENIFKMKYKIDLSVQSPSTDVIAVDTRNRPCRDSAGRLVFRPGGHGALLENMNKLDADLIFVKNIDNVVPASHLEKILPYKKLLGGLALHIREEIFAFLKKMEKRELSQNEIDAIADYCRNKINIVFESDFRGLSARQKRERIFSYLNRPLRVCAMVRNAGEPGGAPFWIQEKNKMQSLQIVESAHVNKTLPSQLSLWLRASYFNPVDMVCCTKNYRGEKFDLKNYVNEDAYLIAIKTEKGRQIKAQEMPGLWNGSMARWNTIFVEFPLKVFNPVKTVDDLLRSQHQASKKYCRLK